METMIAKNLLAKHLVEKHQGDRFAYIEELDKLSFIRTNTIMHRVPQFSMQPSILATRNNHRNSTFIDNANNFRAQSILMDEIQHININHNTRLQVSLNFV